MEKNLEQEFKKEYSKRIGDGYAHGSLVKNKYLKKGCSGYYIKRWIEELNTQVVESKTDIYNIYRFLLKECNIIDSENCDKIATYITSLDQTGMFNQYIQNSEIFDEEYLGAYDAIYTRIEEGIQASKNKKECNIIFNGSYEEADLIISILDHNHH